MTGLIPVTLKQHRLEIGLAVIGPILVVAVWLLLRYRILGVTVPDGCVPAGASMGVSCDAAIAAIRPAVAAVGDQVMDMMRVVPLAAGLLAGVPIVARELETGTAQTAWSLNGSRRRWLTRQVGIVAAPTLLAVGAASVVASDTEGLRRAALGGPGVLDVGLYGVSAFLRGAAALSLGVFLGALLARSFAALSLGAMLCFVLLLSAGVAREGWISQQPKEPVAEGTTTSIQIGVAYRTPEGTVISEIEAMARVPPDVASQDVSLAQPVASATWLERRGYALVALGVSQATAMGWATYELTTTGAIVVVSLVGALLIVDRRRPT